MRQQALDAIRKYQLHRASKKEIHGRHIDFEVMIYDFTYIFLHPWIKSAIKPQYRWLVKEWI
jgi:hypothetical protein